MFKPEIEVIKFAVEDVITTSTTTPEDTLPESVENEMPWG